MTSAITRIFQSLQGVFLPKRANETHLVKEIAGSLNDFRFYGREHDRKNMKRDAVAFNRDFNKAKKK